VARSDQTVEQRLTVVEVLGDMHTEQISELVVDMAELKNGIKDAAKDGAREAFSDMISQMQSRAAESTGRWIWGTLKAFFSRWVFIGLIVLVVGRFAGWPMANAVFDAILGKGKP